MECVTMSEVLYMEEECKWSCGVHKRYVILAQGNILTMISKQGFISSLLYWPIHGFHINFMLVEIFLTEVSLGKHLKEKVNHNLLKPLTSKYYLKLCLFRVFFTYVIKSIFNGILYYFWELCLFIIHFPYFSKVTLSMEKGLKNPSRTKLIFFDF